MPKRGSGKVPDSPAADFQGSDTSNLGRKIYENASVVGELSTSISLRIAKFETWLKDLPGKVASTTYWEHPNAPGYLIGLQFEKYRQWRLLFAIVPETTSDGDIEWNPLTEAPIEIKIMAISGFPDLLVALHDAQSKLSAELETANRDFDAFANSIGLGDAKEGDQDEPL